MNRIVGALVFVFTLLEAFPADPGQLPIPEIRIETNGQWRGFTGQWKSSQKPALSVRMNSIPATIKFHGSYHTRKAAEKPSFRLDWQSDKGTRKTLILKAGYFDRSRLREWLGLKMFGAAGILSPKAELVKLSADGVLQGVYLSIVPIDAQYIRSISKPAGPEGAPLLYYGDPSGAGRKEPDFLPLNKSAMYKSVYTPVLADTDPGSGEIDKLMLALNTRPFDILNLAAFLDIEQWALWFSVSGIMENWDSPWHRRGNNYSLYRPSRGRWQLLPWDPDHIFEEKGLYFPLSRVKGLQSLLSAQLFLQKVRSRTWQLIHGKLSSGAVIRWIEEAEESLKPFMTKAKEPGLKRKEWSIAVKELKRNIRKRFSRLEEILCPAANCTDEMKKRLFSTGYGRNGEPVLW